MTVKGNVLEINMTRYTDTGTYQCFARSKYGEVSTATQVVVKGTHTLDHSHLYHAKTNPTSKALLTPGR